MEDIYFILWYKVLGLELKIKLINIVIVKRWEGEVFVN